MNRTSAIPFFLMLALGLPALSACNDDNEKFLPDTDDPDRNNESDVADLCTCGDPGVTLTAVSGCENFGGDQEQCSGWESCEEENGLAKGSIHAGGTQLTCFGCTIEITCP